jgi:RimJ/RimL family protein N-acetyltransferase
MQATWIVRRVSDHEYQPWTQLFRGYCDFYEWPTTDEHQQQIWSWIHERRLIDALVAVETDGAGNELGSPVGLAHLREWVRPLRGVLSGYLDDLYVEPSSRGKGAVEALFTAINRMALEREWSVVRWTTATDNARAQTVYKKVAVRTSWVTYDMTPTKDGPLLR